MSMEEEYKVGLMCYRTDELVEKTSTIRHCLKNIIEYNFSSSSLDVLVLTVTVIH